MPNWNDVLNEIATTNPEGQQSPFDVVRRKYLKELSEYTGRNVIAYYSGFLTRPNVFGTQINDEDTVAIRLNAHLD